MVMVENRYTLYNSRPVHLDRRRVLDAEIQVEQELVSSIENLEKYRTNEKNKEALEVLSGLCHDLDEIISDSPDETRGQVFSL